MRLYATLLQITALLISALSLPHITYSQIITTFAGNGSPSYGGDGGQATAAQIDYPTRAVIDPAGNLYFCDYTNARIRKIDVTGVITTVAGNGTPGYSGDGLAATLASIQGPAGIALDAAGNIYFADWLNFRVRKISTSGIITTIAGTGVYGYSGDGTAATSAQVSKPWGIAVDNAGNVLLADRYNNRIRKVDTAGIITTIAGNGTPGWMGDGGPATAGEINDPCDLALDISGNLYFAEYMGNRVRKVSSSGNLYTVAGNGSLGFSGDGGQATAASLAHPVGVGVDKETATLYIGDYDNYRVRKVDPIGTISTIAGTGVPGYSGDGGPATNAQLEMPYGVILNANGDVIICDPFNYRIRIIRIGSLSAGKNTVQDELSVFPNPSCGTFTLKVSSAQPGDATAVIYNLAGEKIREMCVFKNENNVIALDEPAGVYLVSVFCGTTSLTKMVTIQ